MVWVNCYDVPFKFWNQGCFCKLIAYVGSIVMVDERTMFFSMLDKARILVRTSVTRMINKHQ